MKDWEGNACVPWSAQRRKRRERRRSAEGSVHFLILVASTTTEIKRIGIGNWSELLCYLYHKCSLSLFFWWQCLLRAISLWEMSYGSRLFCQRGWSDGVGCDLWDVAWFYWLCVLHSTWRGRVSLQGWRLLNPKSTHSHPFCKPFFYWFYGFFFTWKFSIGVLSKCYYNLFMKKP